MIDINKYDFEPIAKKYGTPLYLYDADRIRANIKRIKDAFEKYYPKTEMHYSVKANNNIHILKIFKEAGLGTDCSSPLEVKLSRIAGFDEKDILYTGNYESSEDIKAIFNNDICINLDDIESFRKMIKIGKPDRISFRINPGIGRGGHEGITTAGADAKFGVPYEKAYEAYKEAYDAGIRRFGIHMMTGSNNLEPYYFAEITDKLMNIAGRLFNQLGCAPEYVDIGGGYGVPYEDDEDPLNVDVTAKLISEALQEKCVKYNLPEPVLKLEPGRYFVADAGYLLTRVISVKKSYKTFAGVDAGMNTLIRPALYGAKHRSFVNGKEDNKEFVNVCGRICENSDIFGQNMFLPKLEAGDLIVMRDVGAYGYVMASSYNGRLKPAEVLIDANESRLIRRRETDEDFLTLLEE
ncbi:MAG: diaminopimelate decarboxylase [Candidatus Kapabacteria bacterium]|jgi:diaminopimelate decarboxylase|nr:diaminopimelate decarboxylase [Candidatus Kapabacteria bacterium]